MVRRKHVRQKLRIRWVILLFLLVLIVGLTVGIYAYKLLFAPSVSVKEENGVTYLYIPTGATFERVVEDLCEQGIVSDCEAFKWLARQMNYHKHVYPGRYRIDDDMSYPELIRMLRSGRQEPLILTWRKFRFLPQIAGFFGKHLEPDSQQIIKVLTDTIFLAKYGLTPQTVLAIFIPDTYEFLWNTSPEQLIDRMYREYENFWTEERLAKAKKIGLSPMQVMILASIVESETYRVDEMPIIAGVYLNRLRKGMRLQADPTIKYALGDWSIRRITWKMLEVESPYNTYKYKGLPPGPIGTPSKQAIDAVLNATKHDFLFFCARTDGSGYHDFSRTFQEHLACARRWRQYLNQKIRQTKQEQS